MSRLAASPAFLSRNPREAVRQWAQQEATRKPEDDAFRFVIENETAEVVGDLTTHHCDARVGSFSYGITIRREHRRNGYAAEAIALVLRYYFRELRYQKATVSVYSFNEASARLHESLGFQLEGRIRRTVFTDGQHCDELVYGITAEEFRCQSHSTISTAIPSGAHAYIHSATSIGKLMQPWLIGTPKFSCQ